MFFSGDGVAQNKKEAAYWYGKAAGQGNALAQNALAIMYMKGDGVSRDDRKAFDLFREAARKRIPEAQANLALLYARGQGTEKNYLYACVLANHAAMSLEGIGKWRNELEKVMTKDELARARSMTVDDVLK